MLFEDFLPAEATISVVQKQLETDPRRDGGTDEHDSLYRCIVASNKRIEDGGTMAAMEVNEPASSIHHPNGNLIINK